MRKEKSNKQAGKGAPKGRKKGYENFSPAKKLLSSMHSHASGNKKKKR